MKTEKTQGLRIVTLAVLLACVTSPVAAQIESRAKFKDGVLKQCQGEFKGKKVTLAELKLVLERHKQWLSSFPLGKPNPFKKVTDPGRANLCGANVAHVDLSGAVLQSVDLSGSDLAGLNLSGAELGDVNLSGAGLLGVNFSGASLERVNLNGAVLVDVNLSGASLLDSSLKGTELVDVNLAGANLAYTNLSGAIFEPTELPVIDTIAETQNLSQLWFRDSPQALVKLRKAFKEAGYREQERAITYAIKHSELRKKVRSKEGRLDAGFQYVFFELTTAWGAKPGRALLILVCLIPLFAFPYVLALRRPGKDGIWRVWSTERMRQDLGRKKPIRLKVGLWSAIGLGLYFSVLSAFHIGWRDLNVGNWIARMQAREYTLRASGWVRSVSGLQSLLSVYLLAIWAITYFGRPFE